MALYIKFVNHNSVPEDQRQYIELHKDYEIQSAQTSQLTDPDGAKIAVGFIDNENGNIHSFAHHRSRFNGTVITSSEVEHSDPEVAKWGHYYDISSEPFHERGIHGWLNSQMWDTFMNTVSIHDRLARYRPFRSELKEGNISLTQSRDKFEANKQTSMAPGRAIKFMFPEITDAQLEVVVDNFRKAFSHKDYVLKSGTSKEDFKHAYVHDIEAMQNPNTTSRRKSLVNSCMRYSFDHLPHHPAEAYGSGDFTILWVENEHGQIAARAVYAHERETHAPIYGTSEQAMDMIQAEFDKLEVSYQNCDEGWNGLKLLRHENNCTEFCAPYIDVPNRGLEDDGEHLVFSQYGDIDTSDHQGVLYAGGSYYCEYCEERHSQEEYYTETHGSVCEDCYENNFFMDSDGYCYHLDYAVRVYYKASWGVDYELRHEDDHNGIYVEYRDEYWHEDYVYYSEYSDEHFTQIELDNGTYEEFDGEYYYYDSEYLAELKAEQEAA